MEDSEKHSLCLFETQEFRDGDAETRFDFDVVFLGSFQVEVIFEHHIDFHSNDSGYSRIAVFMQIKFPQTIRKIAVHSLTL